MRYGNARNLHKGDEVLLKDTGEIVTVNEVEDLPLLKSAWVYVESPSMGYIKVSHKWIK